MNVLLNETEKTAQKNTHISYGIKSKTPNQWERSEHSVRNAVKIVMGWGGDDSYHPLYVTINSK